MLNVTDAEVNTVGEGHQPYQEEQTRLEAAKSMQHVTVANAGKRNSTHDEGQCQQALQHFVLLFSQLVFAYVSIAVEGCLRAGSSSSTSSSDLLNPGC